MDTPIIQNKNNKYRAKCFKFITKYQKLIEAALFNNIPEINPLFEIKRREFKKLVELLAKNYDYELFAKLKSKVKTNKGFDKLDTYEKERLLFYYMLTQKESGHVLISEKKAGNALYSKKVDIPSCEYWNKILLQNSFTKDEFNTFVGKLHDLVNDKCKVTEAPKEVYVNFFDDEIKNGEDMGKIFIESDTFLEVIELSQFFLGEKSLEYLNDQKFYAYQRSFAESISTFLRLRFGKFLLYQTLTLAEAQLVLFTSGTTLFSYGLRPSRDVDLGIFFREGDEINIKFDEVLKDMDPCFFDVGYVSIEEEVNKKYPMRKYLFDNISSFYAFGVKILNIQHDTIKTRFRRFSTKKSKKALGDYIFILYTYGFNFNLPEGSEEYLPSIYPVIQRRYKTTKSEENEIRKFIEKKRSN
jgi:hypothetical protein